MWDVPAAVFFSINFSSTPPTFQNFLKHVGIKSTVSINFFLFKKMQNTRIRKLLHIISSFYCDWWSVSILPPLMWLFAVEPKVPQLSCFDMEIQGWPVIDTFTACKSAFDSQRQAIDVKMAVIVNPLSNWPSPLGGWRLNPTLPSPWLCP